MVLCSSHCLLSKNHGRFGPLAMSRVSMQRRLHEKVRRKTHSTRHSRAKVTCVRSWRIQRFPKRSLGQSAAARMNICFSVAHKGCEFQRVDISHDVQHMCHHLHVLWFIRCSVPTSARGYELLCTCRLHAHTVATIAVHGCALDFKSPTL